MTMVCIKRAAALSLPDGYKNRIDLIQIRIKWDGVQ